MLSILAVCLVVVSTISLKYDFFLEKMWDFLVVDEEPKPADVIIVISGSEDRVPYGVELYQLGYADTLLLSGGSAQNLKKQALSLGVPEDHILLESKSNTTFGNAKYSSEIVRDQGFTSAILVTSPFHTRRAGMFFKQFFEGVDLTVCSVPYDPSLANSWWKDERISTYVVAEYMKFVWHYLFER